MYIKLNNISIVFVLTGTAIVVIRGVSKRRSGYVCIVLQPTSLSRQTVGLYVYSYIVMAVFLNILRSHARSMPLV